MGHVTATLEFWEWSNLMTRANLRLNTENRTVSQITLPKINNDTPKKGAIWKGKCIFQTLSFKGYVSFRGYKTIGSASGESQVDFEFNLYAIWDTTQMFLH